MRWPSIVLEGPDGGGKTYAANYILQRDSYSYRHEGIPPEGSNLIDYYQLQWERYPHPVVADRFVAGELAYGPAMRDGARYSFEEAYEFCVRNFWSEPQALHVLMIPPIGECLLTWSKRAFEGREYITEYDRFHQMYDNYWRLARRGLFDVVVGAKSTAWVDALFDGTLPGGGDVLWVLNDTYRLMTLEDFSRMS